MFAVFLACGLFATRPADIAATVSVDRVDVNHVYRWDGSVVFDQLILWRWSNLHRRFYSVGYVMLRGGRRTDDAAHHAEWSRMIAVAHKGNTQTCLPTYKGKWVGCDEVPRFDGRKFSAVVERSDNLYRIEADWVQETHTVFDPEALDRAEHPDIDRRWVK